MAQVLCHGNLSAAAVAERDAEEGRLLEEKHCTQFGIAYGYGGWVAHRDVQPPPTGRTPAWAQANEPGLLLGLVRVSNNGYHPPAQTGWDPRYEELATDVPIRGNARTARRRRKVQAAREWSIPRSYGRHGRNGRAAREQTAVRRDRNLIPHLLEAWEQAAETATKSPDYQSGLFHFLIDQVRPPPGLWP